MIYLPKRSPELEAMQYTFCPHCRKRGKSEAMQFMPEMSFRNKAVYICPKCGTTLDRPVDRLPRAIRPKIKSQVFSVPK